MARGRMIASTLGRSAKWNDLDHFAKIVYILTLTHTDEKGRIEADPVDIYADSFVRDETATPVKIDCALEDIATAGLIRLYTVGEKRYAEFVDFEEHNTIRRDKDGNPTREARSRIPDPPTSHTPTPQGPRSDRAVTAQEPPPNPKTKSKTKTKTNKTLPPVEKTIEASPTYGDTTGPKALAKLKRDQPDMHAHLQRHGPTLGWKFRHLNLAAQAIHEHGQTAIDALDATIKGADQKGASAYRYFEAVLTNPKRGAPNLDQERDYSDDVSGADLLDGITLNGRWAS